MKLLLIKTILLLKNFLIIVKIYLNIFKSAFLFILEMLYLTPIKDIICDCFLDLLEFYRLLIKEIVIPRREYKKEERLASINSSLHKKYIKQLKREEFFQKSSKTEYYIHKGIDFFFMFCVYFTFLICAFSLFILLKFQYDHEYKPIFAELPPPEYLKNMKLNDVPLESFELKKYLYEPPVNRSQETFIEYLSRRFKSAFVANEVNEKFTGDPNVFIITKKEYEAMTKNRKLQPNKDSGNKKAFLDDLSLRDVFDPSWFFLFYSFLINCNFYCDNLIYYNINYLFTDVITYIC
jgi:hypothetical protein